MAPEGRTVLPVAEMGAGAPVRPWVEGGCPLDGGLAPGLGDRPLRPNTRSTALGEGEPPRLGLAAPPWSQSWPDSPGGHLGAALETYRGGGWKVEILLLSASCLAHARAYTKECMQQLPEASPRCRNKQLAKLVTADAGHTGHFHPLTNNYCTTTAYLVERSRLPAIGRGNASAPS